MSEATMPVYPPLVRPTAPSGTRSGIHPRTAPEARRGDLAGSPPEDLFSVEWDTPRHRATDPATSALAAASVEEMPERRRAVWSVLAGHGPLTDEGIAAVYANLVATGYAPAQSPSGLRTRRSELVRAGLVVDSGERGMTSTGRAAVRWAIAPEVAR